MRILTKYVLREFLVPLNYCVLGLSMIFIVLDLFRQFDRILAARPPMTMLARYFAGYLAVYMQWLLPAALLMAGLYAMWQLARHAEITAMRASGIPFLTITAPMLWTGVVLALLSGANSEFFAPGASRVKDRILDNRFKPPPKEVLFDVPYHNYAARRAWRIARFEPQSDGYQMYNVRITTSRPSGVPESVMTVRRAEYLDGTWWFHQPSVTHYDDQGQPLTGIEDPGMNRDLVPMPQLNEAPRDFLLEVMQSEFESHNFSLRDMIRYVKARPRLPRIYKVAWRYDIYARLASPWACVVIVLLAVPAGVASGRQSVFMGVLMAISSFVAYFALTIFCMAMAKKDWISIGVGAWLPNLLFLLIGIVLFRRQK